MSKKLLSSAIALSLVMGLTSYQLQSGRKEKPNFDRPKGYEHRHKSEEEKQLHKAHQKKIKAKRNAKRGIYEVKIKYPKKRY